MMDIDGVRLDCTCWACPEQYDAWLGGVRIGYLRLRHGGFAVEYPNCGGELVYEAEPEGDGRFEDHERERHLAAAVAALKARHQGAR